MTLEEIFKQWNDDSKVDMSELGIASLKTPELHHKYFKILSQERLVLKNMEVMHKKLWFEKFEFYLDGPTKEQVDAGWKLPPKGKILKSDVKTYLDGDDELLKSQLKLDAQKEKIDALESIIRMIMNRSYHINNAIEWYKFTHGV